MSVFSKKLILVLLLKFSGVTTVAWGAERWSPSITYGEIVSKAQAGSPYFQGLLGIYLRSGEAGSKVGRQASETMVRVRSSQRSPIWFLQPGELGNDGR